MLTEEISLHCMVFVDLGADLKVWKNNTKESVFFYIKKQYN